MSAAADTAGWREGLAKAVELQVCDIERWLDGTETILAIAEHHHHEQVAMVLRSTSGLVKTWRNELIDQGRELRMVEP